MTDETQGRRKLSAEEAAQVWDDLRSHYRQPADYEYWVKFPSWTPDQASALLLGMEPGKMPTKRSASPSGFEGDISHTILCEPWAETFYKLRTLLLANFRDAKRKYTPSEFVAWAKQNGYADQGELCAAITQKQATPADAGTAGPGALGERERDTLLKIIGAMAQIMADLDRDFGKHNRYRKPDGTPNCSTIQTTISERFPRANGMGKSTVGEKIAAGLRLLDD